MTKSQRGVHPNRNRAVVCFPRTAVSGGVSPHPCGRLTVALHDQSPTQGWRALCNIALSPPPVLLRTANFPAARSPPVSGDNSANHPQPFTTSISTNNSYPHGLASTRPTIWAFISCKVYQAHFIEQFLNCVLLHWVTSSRRMWRSAAVVRTAATGRPNPGHNHHTLPSQL